MLTRLAAPVADLGLQPCHELAGTAWPRPPPSITLLLRLPGVTLGFSGEQNRAGRRPTALEVPSRAHRSLGRGNLSAHNPTASPTPWLPSPGRSDLAEFED